MSLPQNSKIELITAESRTDIDQWVAKYPVEQKRSAVMAALRIVQDQNGGWISGDLIDAVAEYLDMTSIAVYEVASFYSMYELKPVGRHKICLCTNVSCMICGSDNILDYLKQRLGIGFGETTPDGRFSLKEVECLGACGGAPMMQIHNKFYENLTSDKIEEILAGLE